MTVEITGDLWRPWSAPKGVIGHRGSAPCSEEGGATGNEAASTTTASTQPVERPVVLGDHPVGMLRRGRSPARASRPLPARTRPASPADGAAAQVDVLDVHEIPLIPPANGVQGAAAARPPAPRPVDLAGAARVRIQLPVPPGERIGRPDEPEKPVTNSRRTLGSGADGRRSRPCCGSAGRPLRGRAPSQTAHQGTGGAFFHLEVGVAHRTDRRRWRRCRGWRRGVAEGSRPGAARSQRERLPHRGRRAVGRPVVHHNDVRRAAGARVVEQRLDKHRAASPAS